MIRMIVIGIAIVALILLVAWVFRDPIYFQVMAWNFKPGESFSEETVAQPPDYADPASWAALPDREDGADFEPQGVTDGQANAPLDVFFVHPTTFLSNEAWNQPLDDEQANDFVDKFVLRAQASVFNGCCKVYAPRYRQATLFSFMDSGDNGAQAMDLAYSDVEAAFDYFLENFSQGRPFVIAAHSQGSRHVELLLKRRVTGTPLTQRLVAAYAIGFGISKAALAKEAPDIPVCGSALESGCLVTWNAVGPRAQAFEDTSDYVCVNPLTWTADDAYAPHEGNLGAMSLEGNGAVHPQAADAQCQDGRLMVSEIRTEAFQDLPFYLGQDNYHVLDYSLFYLNLRQNAQERTAAFLGG